MNVETLLTLAYRNVNYVFDSEISQTAGNREDRCTRRVGGNGKGLSPSKRRLELTFPTVTTLGAGDVAQSVECSLSTPEAVGSIFNPVPTRQGGIALLISAAGRRSKEDRKFK